MRGCGDWECIIEKPKKVGSNGGCRCPRYVLEREIRMLRAQQNDMLALLEAIQDIVPDSPYRDKIRVVVAKARGAQ